MNGPVTNESPTRSYPFGKTRRLLTASHYQQVFDHISIRQHGKYFTFLCAPGGSNTTRLGLAIAKKHIPLAARRNLLKRVIRETFRTTFFAGKNSGPQLDVIVLAKPAANRITKAQLTQELNRQWQLLIQRNQSLVESHDTAKRQPGKSAPP